MSVDRYLVVGNPVDQSLSPQIHAHFAAQLNDSVDYAKQRVEIGGFTQAVDQFRESGGCGLNVTVPFKVDAFNYVDECDEHAHSAGAVNTIFFGSTGEGESANPVCKGFNTDGIGLVRDLIDRHGLQLEGANILLLGAGGASQGVLLPLIDLAPAQICIVNRTENKAHVLATRFRNLRPNFTGRLIGCGYDQYHQEVRGPADLVINATSIGLGEAEIPLTAAHIEGSFCYDMSYGEKARFYQWARLHGARESVDGLGMLVEQAAAAFALWRQRAPDTAEIYAHLRNSIGNPGL